MKQYILTNNVKRLSLSTVALDKNQYLNAIYHASIVETYCIGFTNNKRDKSLDGYYFTKELSIKPLKISEVNYDANNFIS